MSRTTAAICPEQETLAHFLGGQVSDSQLAFIENHLRECDVCGDTIRALHVDDTLLGLARANRLLESSDSHPNLAELDGSADQSALAKLMERLQANLPPEASEVDRAAEFADRVDEVKFQLNPAEGNDELGRLAHYRILRLLGVGAMGVVFLAEDTQLQRPVALKILRPSLGESARQRFLLEARATAAIDHDHIVTIYEVGQVGALAYISMQFLEGETLDERLKRDGTLATEQAIEYGCQIADGLAAAHAKDLIHRDVKPANIWLEANRCRAKLLDFGLARAINDNPDLTETGMIAGTPAYMSPEQASGQPIDDRSDLFSLGALLYRMATGKLPFQATNALAMLKSIQNEQPKDPTVLNSSIPDTHANMIMWLLEKNANDRPQSAVNAKAGLRSEIPVPNRKRISKAASHGKKSSLAITNYASWFFRIALLVGLGYGGIQFAPQIIRIVTDQGVIVVDSPDANVTVELLAESEAGTEPKVVRSVNLSESNQIEIRSGRYLVRITEGNHQLAITDDQITVTRGGESKIQLSAKEPAKQLVDPIAAQPNQVSEEEDATIIQVYYLQNAAAESILPSLKSLFAGKIAKSSLNLEADPRTNRIIASGTYSDLSVVEALLMKLDEKVTNDNAALPTFGEKTAAQWIMVLSTDRQPERIAEAIQALRTLNVEGADLARFLTALTEVISKFGLAHASVSEGSFGREAPIDRINFEARLAIRALGAEKTVDFIKPLIESNSLGGISFPMYLTNKFLSAESLTEQPLIMDRSELENELRSRFDEVTLPLLPSLQHEDERHRTQAWATFGHLYELANPKFDPNSDWAKTFAALCEASLEDDHSTVEQFCVIEILRQIQPDHPKLTDAAVTLINGKTDLVYGVPTYRYSVVASESVANIAVGDRPVVAPAVELLTANPKLANRSVETVINALAFYGINNQLSPSMLEILAAADEGRESAIPVLKNLLSQNPTADIRDKMQSILVSIDPNSLTTVSETNDAVVDAGDEAVAPPTQDPADPRPRFDGRNVRQWLDQLKVERQPERIGEAIRALRTLGIGEEDRDEFIELIRPVIDRYGSRAVAAVGGQDTSYDAAERNAAFEARWAIWTLGAEPVLDLFEQLVVSPNLRSRNFAYSLLQQETSTGRETEAYDLIKSGLISGIGNRYQELCSLLAENVEDTTEVDSACLTLGTLYYMARGGSTEYIRLSDQNADTQTTVSSDALIAGLAVNSQLLIRALALGNRFECSVLAARLLAILDPNREGLAVRLATLLRHGGSIGVGATRLEIRELALQGLADLKEERAAPAIAVFVEERWSPTATSLEVIRNNPVAARPYLGILADYLAQYTENGTQISGLKDAVDVARLIRDNLPDSQFDSREMVIRTTYPNPGRRFPDGSYLSVNKDVKIPVSLNVTEIDGAASLFVDPRGSFMANENFVSAAWLTDAGDGSMAIHLVFRSAAEQYLRTNRTNSQHVLALNNQIIAFSSQEPKNNYPHLVATTNIPKDELIRLLNVTNAE